VTDTNLQDFVTSTAARSHITFGDVRRLQRNWLPEGITTREEAEALICLNGKVGRADKTWAQWLVTAITDFAANRERHGVAADQGDQGTVEWLERLLRTATMSTSLGRRIARELRREIARLHPTAAEPTEANDLETMPVDQVAVAPIESELQEPQPEEMTTEASPAPQPLTTRKSFKRARSAPRSKRSNDPSTTTLPMIWSSGMAEKHLRFQLAEPC
jgi:hypothetical protein